MLGDIVSADDVAPLSHRHDNMDNRVAAPDTSASKLGLLVSKEKTRTMRVNQSTIFGVKLQDEYLVELDQLSCLRSTVSKVGRTDQDAKARVEKASAAFKTLKHS